MMQQITPYSATTPIFTPVKRNATQPTGAASTTGTGSSGTSTSGTGTSASDIGSTFLSLLVEELQNQDPTNPMDSTAMTGQMISLNQLDQLVSINQAVGGDPGTLTGASTGSSGATAARSYATGKPTATVNPTTTLNSTATLSATGSPYSPNAMLPQ